MTATQLRIAPSTERDDVALHKEREDDQKHEGETAAQKAERRRLRAEGLQKISAAVEGTIGLTRKDLEGWRQVLSDEDMDRGGATTHEEKLRWMRDNVYRNLPSVITEVQIAEGNFLSKINAAAAQGWISLASAERWRKRLGTDAKLWYQKKPFLEQKFPRYYQNWAKLHTDVTQAKEKMQRLKLTAKDVPEMAQILDSGFNDRTYLTRRVLVDSALAALAAKETNRLDLHGLAKEKLLAAVSAGALHPSKVSVWMRRIFESHARDDLIKTFLTGSGGTSLSSLIDSWSDVRRRFDNIEAERSGKMLSGFTFVNSKQFLNWHFARRLSYVEEVERRFNARQNDPKIFWNIRHELDVRDWGSAQALIDQAFQLDLDEKHQAELRSMQRYLTQQQVAHPQPQPTEEEQNDPNLALKNVMDEVQHISPSMHALYAKTIHRADTETFAALCQIVGNRCWCHENGVLDENQEEKLRQEAEEKTKDVVLHGHTDDHENNSVPGYGNPAIRDYDGEWASQILHMDNSPNSHDALISACEAQKNNHAFRYWTTVIPEDLSYAEHQYITYNLNWRIKAALRTGATLNTPVAPVNQHSQTTEVSYGMAG